MEYCNDPHCDCPKMPCTRKHIVKVPTLEEDLRHIGLGLLTFVILGAGAVACLLLKQKFGAS